MVAAARGAGAAFGQNKEPGPGQAVELLFRGVAGRGASRALLPRRQLQPGGVRGPDGGDAGAGRERVRGAAGGDERGGAGPHGARDAGEGGELLRAEGQQEAAEEVQEEEAAAHLLLGESVS